MFFSISIAIVIVSLYLIFALITENKFYSSALVTLFIYDKKKGNKMNSKLQRLMNY